MHNGWLAVLVALIRAAWRALTGRGHRRPLTDRERLHAATMARMRAKLVSRREGSWVRDWRDDLPTASDDSTDGMTGPARRERRPWGMP
jgi:hypothetical protein